MSITIRQRDKGYNIEIDNEVWSCEDRKDMQKLLDTLLDLKNTKGRLKK